MIPLTHLLPRLVCAALLVSAGCGNPFAPDTARPPDDDPLPPAAGSRNQHWKFHVVDAVTPSAARSNSTTAALPVDIAGA